MADETPKKVAERFMEKESERDVYAMSNLRPSETGINGAVVWASEGTHHGRKLPYGPRVKVMVGERASQGRDSASVSVEANPRVVAGSLPTEIQKDATRWIQLNRTTLEQYWNDEITTTEFHNRLQKLP